MDDLHTEHRESKGRRDAANHELGSAKAELNAAAKAFRDVEKKIKSAGSKIKSLKREAQQASGSIKAQHENPDLVTTDEVNKGSDGAVSLMMFAVAAAGTWIIFFFALQWTYTSWILAPIGGFIGRAIWLRLMFGEIHKPAEELKQQIRDARSRIEGLEADLAEYRSQIDPLKAEVRSAERVVSEKQDIYGQAQREYDTLQVEVAEAEERERKRAEREEARIAEFNRLAGAYRDYAKQRGLDTNYEAVIEKVEMYQQTGAGPVAQALAHMDHVGAVDAAESREDEREKARTEREDAAESREDEREKARMEREDAKDRERVKCEKCGSRDLQAMRRGVSTGGAVVGGALFGSIGAMVGGGVGHRDVEVKCINCGHVKKMSRLGE